MPYNLNNVYPKPSINSAGSAVTDQRLTVSSSAVSFATAFNDITSLVVVDVQDADVMATFDGSTPTSTNGHRLYVGDRYTWSKATATAAKFIRQGSTDAAVHASEFQV